MNGDMVMLKYAREKGCRWDLHTCFWAAKRGDLAMLKYAREEGCPWDEETCWVAAMNGHLEVVKYARRNGCAWNERTCMFAAANGYLEVLIWARMEGCPWNKNECLRVARKHRYSQISTWIRSDKPTCGTIPAKREGGAVGMWLKCKIRKWLRLMPEWESR